MKIKWNRKTILCICGVLAIGIVIFVGLLSEQIEQEVPIGTLEGEAGVVAITKGDPEEAKKIPDDGIFTMVTRSLGFELNPIFASKEGEKMVVDLIFEPLARRDKDGVMQNVLAKKVAYNDTKDVVTITIENDILFSNGTPLTITDVAISLLLGTMTSVVGTEHIAGVDLFLRDQSSLPSGLQIIDENTLQITFDEYGMQNEQVLEIPIQKASTFDFGATLGDLSSYTQNLLGNGIGTNAYKLKESNGSDVYLVENSNYREPIQSIKDIRIYDVNYVHIDQMIEDQIIDYIYFGSHDAMLNTFIDDVRYAVYGKETSTVIGLMVNETSVPMKYSYVRQAIHHAIDRRTLLPEVHWYRYKPVASVISGNGYLEGDAQLDSEIDKASEIFQVALEYLNMDSFHMTLPIIEGNDLYESVAAGVEKELQQIGVDVHVKPKDVDGYIDSLYLLNDYDLYLEEVNILSTADDYKNFAREYFDEMPAHFDEVFQNIAKAVTTEEKNEAYKKADEMMQEYSLFIPVARSQNFIGIAASWSGYAITPYTDAPENLYKAVYGD
ncbi:MAG: ABC transporter substrate-binding protein [Bacillota bacterium]